MGNYESTPDEAYEGPYFGELRCSECGRHWYSRFCWKNSYQKCKRCRKKVYAHNLRKPNPSDWDDENNKEHPMALCERCQKLGRYCARTTGNNSSECTIL